MARTVLSVLDAIALGGEDDTRKALGEFTWSKNSTIQHFVRSNAVNFTKQDISITHLVYSTDDNPLLLGFFALTYKILRLAGSSLSRTSEKHIARFAEYDAATNIYTLPAPPHRPAWKKRPT